MLILVQHGLKKQRYVIVVHVYGSVRIIGVEDRRVMAKLTTCILTNSTARE